MTEPSNQALYDLLRQASSPDIATSLTAIRNVAGHVREHPEDARIVVPSLVSSSRGKDPCMIACLEALETIVKAAPEIIPQLTFDREHGYHEGAAISYTHEEDAPPVREAAGKLLETILAQDPGLINPIINHRNLDRTRNPLTQKMRNDLVLAWLVADPKEFGGQDWYLQRLALMCVLQGQREGEYKQDQLRLDIMKRMGPVLKDRQAKRLLKQGVRRLHDVFYSHARLETRGIQTFAYDGLRWTNPFKRHPVINHLRVQI